MIIVSVRVSLSFAANGIIKSELSFFSLGSYLTGYRVRKEEQCLTKLWFIVMYPRTQTLLSS